MTKSEVRSPESPESFWRGLLWAVLALLVVLLALFHRSLDPSQILFSSDGPLGANSAEFASLPEAFKGMWLDLNWVGSNVGAAFPTLTYLLLWMLKPVAFARFYAPLTLFVLGLGVWVLLRRLGFRGSVCAVGALAAALNSDFLSYACWGLGTLPLAVAGAALCFAALVGPTVRHPWFYAALAGVPLGLSVMEGFDSGAILSLYVAAFVVFQGFSGKQGGKDSKAITHTIVRLVLVTVMAGFTAFEAVSVLLETQVKGIVGMEQDARTKQQRWNEATQWSLPKREALRIVIPGLYGYRMDTPGGGAYWGGVGRDPAWDAYFDMPSPDPAKRPEGRLMRHSGAGFYAGVPVVLLAIWAAAQLANRRSGVFDPTERRHVAFWFVAALVSLLFAFGRHAPFYKIIYSLPYFSTIRNPIKFLHPFSLAVVILSAYGLEGLCRVCAGQLRSAGGSVSDQFRRWWRSPDNSHRSWVIGSGVAVVAAFGVWLVYAARQQELVKHLQQVGFPDPATAASIANHSISEVGVFAFGFALVALWIVLVLAGVFGGKKCKWVVAGTGLLIALDMIRANTPWVQYWNLKEKYASNAVFDLLRQRPYEHRAAIFPFSVNAQMEFLQQLYHAEWLQHGFRYYNIQSLDVVQEPRMAVENLLFRGALYSAGAQGYVRLWELTNTRFLLGLAGNFVDLLNQQFDPNLRRFRLHTAFTLTQETAGGAIGVQTNLTGPFALIEFTGALPRAKLCFDWVTMTNDDTALQMLTSKEFDPHRNLIVCNPTGSMPPPPKITNAPGASVEFVRYAPKDLLLRVRSPNHAVLLLNDKHDRNWTVSVDDKPAELLRCNYLMRGVLVSPGEHTVQFRFGMQLTSMWISLAGMVAGVGLLAFLLMPAGLPTTKR